MNQFFVLSHSYCGIYDALKRKRFVKVSAQRTKKAKKRISKMTRLAAKKDLQAQLKSL